MGRGIERTKLFQGDDDRADFVARVAALGRDGHWVVYTWALMPNHFHLGSVSRDATGMLPSWESIECHIQPRGCIRVASRPRSFMALPDFSGGFTAGSNPQREFSQRHTVEGLAADRIDGSAGRAGGPIRVGTRGAGTIGVIAWKRGGLIIPYTGQWAA